MNNPLVIYLKALMAYSFAAGGLSSIEVFENENLDLMLDNPTLAVKVASIKAFLSNQRFQWLEILEKETKMIDVLGGISVGRDSIDLNELFKNINPN